MNNQEPTKEELKKFWKSILGDRAFISTSAFGKINLNKSLNKHRRI